MSKLSKSSVAVCDLLLTLVLLSIGGGVAAQSDGDIPATLVVPAIDDYLRAVPNVISHQPSGQRSSPWLKQVIDAEFSIRYPDPREASFDLLLAAFRALDSDVDHFDGSRARWIQWLLLNWIEEHDLDLNIVDNFPFEDYTVGVNRRDFDGDGQHEWLLDMRGPGQMLLVILTRDVAGYRIVPTPLPLFDRRLSYTLIAGGFAEELLFDDLNADGLPEWVLALGGFGTNNMNAGELIVLRWQDGTLVNVAPNASSDGMSYDAPAGGSAPVFPHGVRIEFEDTDGDEAREIIIRQAQSDNWGCTWTLQRVFAWNGQQYALMERERVNDAVRGCALRAAEESMWAGDYPAAIDAYESAFALPVDDSAPFVNQVELERYATARLALAYSFAGRHDDAANAASSIQASPDDPPALAELISAVKGHLGDAPAMCRAAYDAFLFECMPGTDACSGSPLHTIVGYTLENYGDDPGSLRYSYPDPSRAGCARFAQPDRVPTQVSTDIAPDEPIATSVSIDQVEPADAWDVIIQTLDALTAGDYQRGLRLLDQGDTMPDVDAETEKAMAYLRALTLELLGQRSEAFAQYAEMNETEPNSSWGRLAAVHLGAAPDSASDG